MGSPVKATLMATDGAIGKYSSTFVSNFLPTATSFGSNLRAFQSNFPSSIAKNIILDGSGSDVIVIQPGSRFMKIGLASQAFPHIVPHVLAKSSNGAPEFDSTDERNTWNVEEEVIQERIAQRYRQSRRKPPPNIYQSLTNYNRQSDYEEISAHNDAFLMEWTNENENSTKIHVGSSALHLNPELGYKLTWPIQRGVFNSRDYSHVRNIVEDLGQLWRGAIVQELNINTDNFEKYCIVLVLPDSFDRVHVKNCVEALMNGNYPFRAITVIQESQAVSFGCGVSSAVVVDCGAQKISVSCIEEGFLVPESRVKIPVGGDEITRLFAELLKLHEFPYEFDLKKPLEWELLDELKERCCTVNDSEIAPSAAIFEFYVRKPNELTKKFLFKMFEERIMAPLALFDPEIPLLTGQGSFENRSLLIDAFDLEDPFVEPNEDTVALPVFENIIKDTENINTNTPTITCNWNNCGNDFLGLKEVFDHFISEHLKMKPSSCEFPDCHFDSNDEISMQCHVIEAHFIDSKQSNLQRFNFCKNNSILIENFNESMSIDDAIIFSILKLNDTERIKKCATSIILSGGSHLFSGFPGVLFDRLSSKMLLNPATALIEAKIFPNSRDLDARFLAWKGGSVFSKLESTSEAWISCGEWSNFGSRSIKEKFSFIN